MTVERSTLLGEEIRLHTLPNGLRIYSVPKRGLTRKIAIMATQYGSIDLRFTTSKQPEPLTTPPGIAHFLEHQLFKKQDRDILMEFGRYGASSNAFTNYSSTAYYFSTTDHFNDCLDMLLNLVYKPYFTAENVAKEKLIIEQELRMYDDSPEYRAYKNLMANLYQKHPVRIDIGGTVESIQKIDPGLLEHCYRVFYHPSNMVMILCGDLDEKEILSQTDKFMTDMHTNGAAPQNRLYPEEPAGVAAPRVTETAVISRPMLIMGYKDLYIPRDPADFILRELATEILLDIAMGKGSPFTQRHYASHLIDDSFSYSVNQEKYFSFSTLGGETDEPDRLAEAIQRQIQKTRKESFSKKDLERAKRKRLGKFLRAFDTADDTAFMLLSFVLNDLDIFEIPALLKHVTRDNVMDRLDVFLHEKNCTQSVIQPKQA